MLHKCTNSQVTKNAITILNKASIVSGSTSSVQKRFKVTLPDLPYDYGALEPVISAEIMQLHHSKHHQTYVNNFNVAAEKLAEAVETGNDKTWSQNNDFWKFHQRHDHPDLILFSFFQATHLQLLAFKEH